MKNLQDAFRRLPFRRDQWNGWKVHLLLLCFALMRIGNSEAFALGNTKLFQSSPVSRSPSIQGQESQAWTSNVRAQLAALDESSKSDIKDSRSSGIANCLERRSSAVKGDSVTMNSESNERESQVQNWQPYDAGDIVRRAFNPDWGLYVPPTSRSVQSPELKPPRTPTPSPHIDPSPMPECSPSPAPSPMPECSPFPAPSPEIEITTDPVPSPGPSLTPSPEIEIEITTDPVPSPGPSLTPSPETEITTDLVSSPDPATPEEETDLVSSPGPSLTPSPETEITTDLVSSPDPATPEEETDLVSSPDPATPEEETDLVSSPGPSLTPSPEIELVLSPDPATPETETDLVSSPDPATPSPAIDLGPSPPPPPTRVVTPTSIKEEFPYIAISQKGAKGKIGVQIPPGKTLNLTNAIFKIPNDVAVAIEINGGKLNLQNVKILFESSVSTVRRVLKSSEQSALRQAIHLIHGANANITSSTFEHITASVVYAEIGSSFVCKDCTFQHVVGVEVSAVYAKGSRVFLENCTFSNNKAKSGGAVTILGSYHGDKSVSLRIRDSIFTGNEADKDGGSVVVQNADKVEITNSRFSGGTVGIQGGGALAVTSSKEIKITGSTFDQNKANGSEGGGALFTFCSQIEIRNVKFDSNGGLDGGAIAVFEKPVLNGRVNIVDTLFSGNRAQNQGGAVLLKTKTNEMSKKAETVLVTISNSSFTKNTAEEGGALYVSSNSTLDLNFNVRINGTDFTNNSATAVGGGMFCGAHSVVNFESSAFHQNKAHTGSECATQCSCSVRQKKSNRIKVKDVSEDFNSECRSGVSPHTSTVSNSESHATTYILITMAVLVLVIIGIVGVIWKHKEKLLTGRGRFFHRSLSSLSDEEGHHQDIPDQASEPGGADQGEGNVSDNASINSHFLAMEADEQFDEELIMDDAILNQNRAPLLP